MHCQFVDTAGGSSGSPRQIKYRSLKCPPIVDEGVTTSGSETRNTACEEEEIHHGVEQEWWRRRMAIWTANREHTVDEAGRNGR